MAFALSQRLIVLQRAIEEQVASAAVFRSMFAPHVIVAESAFYVAGLSYLQFVDVRNRYPRGLFRALNIIKISAPTLEYNRVDGLRMRALHF